MPKPILVVDDAGTSLAELAQALAESGYAPTLVAAGGIAVEHFAAQRPDLVFVSLALPEPLTICEGIRSDPDGAIVPIVLVGRDHPDVRSPADALNQGADFYFELPLDRAKMLAKVQTYIGRGDKTPSVVTVVGAAAAGPAEEPPPPAAAEPPSALTRSADALLAAIEAQEAELQALAPGAAESDDSAGTDPAREQERRQAREAARRIAEDAARREAEQEARRGDAARREAEEMARRDAEALREAEEAERREAVEAAARVEAEAGARREAEEMARRDAEALREAADAERREAAADAREVPEPAAGDTRGASPEPARPLSEPTRDTVEASRRAEDEAWRRTERELRQHDEETRQRSEDELRRRIEQESRQKIEEEVRRRFEDEARQKLEDETRRRLEDEARKRIEDETRRKLEDEARKRVEEETRKRLEDETRKKVEDELRRRAEAEAHARAEEETRRRIEDETRQRLEEEARRRSADAGREAELRRRVEEELRREMGLPPLEAAPAAPPPPTPAPPVAPGRPPPRPLAAGMVAPAPAEGVFDPVQDVASVLATLWQQQVTGRVDFTSQGRQKTLFLERGLAVDAYSTQAFDRIEEYLARENRITRAQYQEVRVKGLRGPRRVAAFLATEGYLKAEELFGAVRGHLQENLFGLFEWEDGAWAYVPERSAEQDRVALDVDPRALILEGIRRKYLLPRMMAKVGGPSSIVARRGEAGDLEALRPTPAEREVARLLDGTRSLEDVVFSTGQDALTVYHLTSALCALGLAEVIVRGLEGGARAGAGQGDAIDLGRIKDKLEQVRNLDYFTMLGVTRAATPYEIDRAYEHVRGDFHPARFSPTLQEQLRDELGEIDQVLGEARQVLRDERLRDAYARHLPG